MAGDEDRWCTAAAKRASLVCDFFVVATHAITYLHGVYPERMYSLRNKYGIATFYSRHDEVNKYIASVFSDVHGWLQRGEVESVVIAVLQDEDGAPRQPEDQEHERDQERERGGQEARGREPRAQQATGRQRVVARYVYDVRWVDAAGGGGGATDAGRGAADRRPRSLAKPQLQQETGRDADDDCDGDEAVVIIAMLRAHLQRLLVSDVRAAAAASPAGGSGNGEDGRGGEKTFDVVVHTTGVEAGERWMGADGAERRALDAPAVVPVNDAFVFQTASHCCLATLFLNFAELVITIPST